MGSEMCIRDRPLTIHNDGSQIRSWCYIEDIIEGILLALERDEAVGHAFNIGNPRSTLTIDQAFVPPRFFQESPSQVSFPNSPGRGTVWKVQRTLPVRASMPRMSPLGP